MGKQLKRSTKTTDKKLALKTANMIEEEYRKKRTSGQIQKLLAEVHQNITGEAVKPVSLASYQREWVDRKRTNGCSKATLTFYEHSTGRFVEFMGGAAQSTIANVSKSDIEAFKVHLLKKLAAKTVNHAIKGLRMLFRSAVEDGKMAENPAEKVDTIKEEVTDESKKEAFTLDQVRSILPFCQGYWRGLVLIGLYTGQRLADIQNLRWRQISADCGTIKLTTRKTGKSLSIPTAAPLKDYLLTLERPTASDSFVHPEAAALKTNSLSGAFAKILLKAAIRTESTGEKRTHSGLSFHSLRHSAVSMMAEAGVPQAAAMAITGHDSKTMHEHYTSVGPEALRKAAESIPTL
jgi:integrase